MVDLHTNHIHYAAIGGIVLAISVSFHYILKGNVTGMSDVIYGIFSFNKGKFQPYAEESPRKMSILAGMLLSGGLFFDIFGYTTFQKFTPFGDPDLIDEQTSFLGFAFAGFFSGIGAKLANGCTSGHGLCGLPRFSLRSFVMVFAVLISAFGIGAIRSQFGLGLFSSEELSPKIQYNHMISANICIMLGFILPIVAGCLEKRNKKGSCQIIFRDIMISWFVGILFGCGLLVSGMCRRINIISFLSIGNQWNPSLLFVLGAAVLFSLIPFNYMIRIKKVPIFGEKLFNPSKKVDCQLVLGGLLFGVGWGIGGLCPGSAIVLFAVWTIPIHLIWWIGLLLGMLTGSCIKKKCSQNADEAQEEEKKCEKEKNDVSDKIDQNESKEKKKQVIET